MDLPSIIGIATLLVGIITAIGVWLGPQIAEYSRRRHQARQEH